MKIRVLRYGASNSINAVIEKLIEEGHDVKKLKLEGSTYRGHAQHMIINWGSSTRGTVKSQYSVLNDPSAVADASDKVRTLRVLDESMRNYIPMWTTDKDRARTFINGGQTVYCRTLTKAREGRGIVIAREESELVRAPLYTCQVFNDRELRAHVFDGEVIDFAQKKRMSSERREEEGIEEASQDIRSHSNGWVFARDGVALPDLAKTVAVDAVSKLGLDFGAVDIIISNDIPKILEVNTAPGLEGTTLESYTNAFLSNISRR